MESLPYHVTPWEQKELLEEEAEMCAIAERKEWKARRHSSHSAQVVEGVGKLGYGVWASGTAGVSPGVTGGERAVVGRSSGQHSAIRGAFVPWGQTLYATDPSSSLSCHLETCPPPPPDIPVL